MGAGRAVALTGLSGRGLFAAEGVERDHVVTRCCFSRIGRILASIAAVISGASLSVSVRVCVCIGVSGTVVVLIVIVGQRRQLQGETFFLT